ncbi:hypothetical protein GUJ93_ZPchr0010g8625 [Zizania palustris]|uniref:Uncharacterized protein n=1 Tax=Zizania palustris TaxID=103762 RepID=A0A8J5W9W2_ZIZPA|nr:hypothetical protein GUJ93_ZPchr0010g8625 [Zizania palustris]
MRPAHLASKAPKIVPIPAGATGHVIVVFLNGVSSWTAMIRIVPADFNRARKGVYRYQASACRRKGKICTVNDA